MVWPKNPTSVEELPVVGINRHKFSVLSRDAELSLCGLVASRCDELEQITGGDVVKERLVAELLVDAAVAVQLTAPTEAERLIIA